MFLTEGQRLEIGQLQSDLQIPPKPAAALWLLRARAGRLVLHEDLVSVASEYRGDDLTSDAKDLIKRLRQALDARCIGYDIHPTWGAGYTLKRLDGVSVCARCGARRDPSPIR